MELMVQAMSAKVGNPLRKLVLLKLADNANDSGECWPSYQYIADQCEIGRSTVKSHIKALIDLGFLKMEARNDGKSSNLYILTISKGKVKAKIEEGEDSFNTVKLEHGQDLTQSDDDLTRSGADPVTRSGADPRTSHSLEPVKEPIKESKPKKPTKGSVLSVLIIQYRDVIPEQSIIDAIEHRQAKRAAHTHRSHSMFFDEVLSCSQGLGISPNAVINIVIKRDWKGVNTEWVRKHLIDNAPPVQQQLAITQAPQHSPNGRQAVSDAINDIQNTDW
jgi:DNA-binding MarR family transcriptional regulator